MQLFEGLVQTTLLLPWAHTNPGVLIDTSRQASSKMVTSMAAASASMATREIGHLLQRHQLLRF